MLHTQSNIKCVIHIQSVDSKHLYIHNKNIHTHIYTMYDITLPRKNNEQSLVYTVSPSYHVSHSHCGEAEACISSQSSLGIRRALHVLSKSYAGENTFYKYLTCIWTQFHLEIMAPSLVQQMCSPLASSAN